ncbi:MAG: hypothetical protein IJ234_11840 [Clostridia bacterium]|nr:hypothetical protein [Clostridia bacterium]
MGWEWHDRRRGIDGRFERDNDPAVKLDDGEVQLHIRLKRVAWKQVRRLAGSAHMSIRGYLTMVILDHLQEMGRRGELDIIPDYPRWEPIRYGRERRTPLRRPAPRKQPLSRETVLDEESAEIAGATPQE